MIFSIKVPQFSNDAQVHFLRCTDEEAKAWQNKQRTSKTIKTFDLNQDSLAYTFRNGFIPLIRFYVDPALNPGIVAHEIAHCAFSMCAHAGIEYSRESEEAYTYLIDFITEKFYKKLAQYVD